MEQYNAHIHASNISIPTLIVHGDQDQDVPVEQSRHTATLIKNCTYHEIPGAGHSFKNVDGALETINALFLNFFVKHM